MKNAIELIGVDMGYNNNTVLQNIHFKIKEGELVSIIGENGAGKTTLFKGIMQMLPLIKGTIKIFDKDITKDKNITWLRTQIGYVPQTYKKGSFPISIFDAVLLGRWGTSFSYFKRPSIEDKILTEKILEVVNLHHIKNKDCRMLSGGEAQRLNIAKALVRKPKILLLDEPAAHLDIYSQNILDKIIENIRSQNDLSILMISHQHTHAKKISDRIIYLNNGQITYNSEAVI